MNRPRGVSPLSLVLVGLLGLLAGLPARAGESIPLAYQKIGQIYGVPARVLYAAAAESTRTLTSGAREPWPWLLSVAGRPEAYATREAAYRALLGHLKAQRGPLKVGLLQIDWALYGRAFPHPWTALDPYYNLAIGALILRERHRETRDWTLAALRFQNATPTRTPLPVPINWDNKAALDQWIRAIARRHRLDPALVNAVIGVESGFRPQARSPAGAQGLMQLMPGTAQRLGVDDADEPLANIEGGSRYLSRLLRDFGDVRLALAAYNAGEGAVARHGNAIPPYRETQQYVPRVLSLYRYFQLEEGRAR